MVHRQLARAAAFLLLATTAALLLPALADAANRRIAISNYQWSTEDLTIDRGEHVTWYWTGPDTMHSITGVSDNAKGWDSDPGTLPRHDIGDNFQLSFDEPGVYRFQCKIHSLVRGTVTVTDASGNPDVEPDPVPKSNVDLKAPKLRQVRLPYRFGPRGAPLKYSLDEAGKLDVEYYRYSKRGKLRYAGYATYKSHVGYNSARVGKRKPHFTPRRGSRYMVKLSVTDGSSNTSKTKKRHFRIW